MCCCHSPVFKVAIELLQLKLVVGVLHLYLGKMRLEGSYYSLIQWLHPGGAIWWEKEDFTVCDAFWDLVSAAVVNKKQDFPACFTHLVVKFE